MAGQVVRFVVARCGFSGGEALLDVDGLGVAFGPLHPYGMGTFLRRQGGEGLPQVSIRMELPWFGGIVLFASKNKRGLVDKSAIVGHDVGGEGGKQSSNATR
jgi:hypothetical protein